MNQTTTPLESIGDRIRIARSTRGLNQSELGRLTGLTSQAINMIESGQTKSPTPENLFNIADALQVDARQLVFGSETAASSGVALSLILNAMPNESTQGTLDFLRYQIERAAPLIAQEKLPIYLTMIDKIKIDMASKVNPSGN